MDGAEESEEKKSGGGERAIERACEGGGGEDEARGQKKRPSVETEGRLTIACHMKILNKDLCCCCSSGAKIIPQDYSENNSMIPNG
jgi:hypothetical protein